MSDRQPGTPPALIAEATKRAGLIWIKVPGAGRARPAWHVWHDGAAYLPSGPGEQPLPGLRTAELVTVLVPSKDAGGLLVTWTGEVSRMEPGSPEWDAVTGLLAAARLNPPAAAVAGDGPAGRVVYRLTPVPRTCPFHPAPGSDGG